MKLLQILVKSLRWILCFFVLMLAISLMASGYAVAGIAFIVLSLFVLPVKGVDSFWKRISQGKKWLKPVLCVLLVFAGLGSTATGTGNGASEKETVAAQSSTSKKTVDTNKKAAKSTAAAKKSTPTPSSTPTATPTPTPTPTATPIPTCDGKSVTSACELNGVKYSKYIYHPAVPEQSHMETKSAPEQTIIGYCTKCNDGTWSPSCAVGRGACSHHGGVAQYNAPQYGTTTKTWQEKVVDAPAKDAYYETEVAQ